MELADGGKVLIAGEFTTANSSVSRARLAQLLPNGYLDLSFDNGSMGADGIVTSLALQNDGKILVGGGFTRINDVTQNHIARLHPDGTVDLSFGAGLSAANDWVHAVLVQPDDKILLAGSFSFVQGETRSKIARLHADGTLDLSFGNGLRFSPSQSSIHAMALQEDGRILVAGSFTSVNGVPRGRIARLNQDGTLDRTFGENLLGLEGDAWIRIHAIVVQNDGRILIGGNFLTVNGEARRHLVRLHDDGTLDPSFAAGLSGPNNTVHAIALSGETDILVGGQFSEVNGQSRRGLVRLQEDGTVDPTFSSNPGAVEAMAQQPDGTILAGYSSLRQIFSNGTVDPRFGTLGGPDFWIRAIAIQPDGKILVGGNFSTFNEMSRGRIVRLHGGPQPEPPFEIRLSQTTITESQSVGTSIGFFTALDSDPGDSHTFALVDGSGDDDNGSFVIDGDILRLAAMLDFELQDTYNIRVQATDRHGLSVETNFSLAIEADPYLVWARALPEDERTPTADPGGFGISNLLRYAFGMNSLNPERKKLPQAGIALLDPLEDEMYLTLTYYRRTDDAALIYMVEGSFDFVDWLPVNGEEEIRGDVNSDTEIVTVIDSEPMTANTKRFLRVRVER